MRQLHIPLQYSVDSRPRPPPTPNTPGGSSKCWEDVVRLSPPPLRPFVLPRPTYTCTKDSNPKASSTVRALGHTPPLTHARLFLLWHPIATDTQVREFLDAALLYADSIAIAVGPPPPSPTDEHGATTADSTPPLLQSIALAAKEAEREAPPDRGVESVGEEGGPERGAAGVVNVFEVTPWGKFTPALNALLGFASRDGAELVMFQVRLEHQNPTTFYHCLVVYSLEKVL